MKDNDQEQGYEAIYITGGHRTRVAAVTLDNVLSRSWKICINSAVLTINLLGISDSIG